ncbi:leukocyte elastase inhibitor-like isoform X2 [Nerophis lumbriciformis]|uniref:leukocyte elastase inhibitor-like isoform X2 n=1 Tax=Nerophis lumbriciformis TaxID=546530 RepID=UPI002ADFAD4C|nr:leukocyte elastase inhibitor-like isoform X2 [Nerophis lumbriciformis]
MASSADILAKANTSFCLDLLRRLSDNDKTANVFFSPFSISSALAMVMLGAAGNTASQMAECLKIEAHDEIHASFAKVLLELNNPKSLYALSVANRLYGEKSYKFVKNATKPVKMMYQQSEFPLTFISEANCQILELPYKGKDLSMLIFLPMHIVGDSTGLEMIETQLTYENFLEWTRPDMMDIVTVKVGLPRFKMEEKYNMKNVLVSMGMSDAFNISNSDFSGMSPAKDLVLSKVIHKAFVEVNEEGTEAAAACAFESAFQFRCVSRTHVFIADHPFLFFIRHNPSMSVLFAGRYCCPV